MASIGIDLDDVVCDFIEPFINICRNLYGIPKLGYKPKDWEWSDMGLTKEQIDLAWKEAKATYNFWERLPVEKGVTPSLLRCLDYEHNVFFITARVPSLGASIKDQSCAWLRDNIGIEYPVVFVTYNKGPLAAALQLDYFIDDRPKNVLEIKSAVPSCHVFIKDSSHNQTFRNPDIPRVRDLDEFIKIVDRASVSLAP